MMPSLLKRVLVKCGGLQIDTLMGITMALAWELKLVHLKELM